MPAGLKWEINFGGTWTDVTTYVDMSSAISIHFGRTSPSQVAQTATLQGLQLKNADGRFTPKSQILLDGVTANPNYPNIVPGAPIRGSYTISATKYYFYYGLIQSWPPMVENGIRAYVAIQAVDRMSLLAGNDVQAAPIQVALLDGALALVPFNDPSDSVTWAEIVGGYDAYISNQSTTTTAVIESGASNPTPFSDGLTGLSLSADAADTGFGGTQTTNIPVPAGTSQSFTFEAWITCGVDPATGFFSSTSAWAQSTNSFIWINFSPDFVAGYEPLTCEMGFEYADLTQVLGVSPSRQILDANPHHYAVVGVDNGSSLTITCYIDGVSVGSDSGTSGTSTFGSDGSIQLLAQGGTVAAGSVPPSVFGPMAFYASSLSATTIALHNAAGTGGSGYTTGQRVAEYLRWAGIAAAGEVIATGIQTVTAHPVAGKTILTLCQDMGLTEGGGSAFYQSPPGLLTFTDRHARFSNSSPVLTFDAEKDLVNDQYAPSFDNLTQITQSTLSRPSGVNQSYTYPGASVILTDTGQTELYPDSDIALLNLAQERVASEAVPAFRVPQLPVDFVTALTSGLYAAFGGISLSSRLRLSNLVAGKTAPLASVDSYCEGWTLTLYQGSDRANFRIVFDTSPADNPPKGKWGTMRDGPIVGDSKLNALISSSATALAIKWTAGPAWTVTSGSYPLIIHIDEEDIQLNGVPSGSTSPQSWTGVTRGVNGTRQAQHSANAVVTMSSIYGNWQL